MTIDMVGYTNHFLSMIHKPPLRWLPCEMCDGQGYNLVWRGTDGRREQVERTCEAKGCDGGHVQIEEGHTRWAEGTPEHPDDRGR